MPAAKLTPSGKPTATTREKHGNKRGAFPIWNAESAKAALSLRGHAQDKAERADVIRRAAKYQPTLAKQAYMDDKKAGLID